MAAPVTTSSGVSDTPARPGISRRTVVRTGATAAWAVPAISIATAAPALAVSGECDLQGSGIVAMYYSDDNRLVITVKPITNVGDMAAGPITLVVRIPRKGGALAKKPSFVSKTGAGWRYSKSYRAGKNWVYVFTYPQGLEGGEQTSQLTFRLKPRKKKPAPSGDVTYVATARNCDPAAGATTIVKS